jgi:hypothetical protein
MHCKQGRTTTRGNRYGSVRDGPITELQTAATDHRGESCCHFTDFHSYTITKTGTSIYNFHTQNNEPYQQRFSPFLSYRVNCLTFVYKMST